MHRDTIPAQCGALLVPERHGGGTGRTIVIPIVRIPAAGSTTGTPVFYLEGGPGDSNQRWRPPAWLRQAHDVVLLGYRGVDGSVRLDCPEVDAALQRRTTDLLGEATRSLQRAAIRTCGERLRADHDLDGYSIEEVVDDVETARKALQLERISLYSTSYGTRIAQRYADRFPAHVHRSLQIGVSTPGAFVWEAAHLDTVIARLGALCRADGACSRRTPDLAATMHRVARNMPRRWGPFPIDRGAVLAGTFGMLYDRSNMATAIDAWLAADAGDASGLALLSFGARRSLSGAMIWGDAFAKGRVDFNRSRDYSSAFGLTQGTVLGAPMSALIWAPFEPDSPWKGAHEIVPVSLRPSDVETLLISGTLDVATPATLATNALLPTLRRGHQILVTNAGHLDLDRLATDSVHQHIARDFLGLGRVDTTAPPVLNFSFDPPTSLPRLAKGLVAGASALVVVLGWGARRLIRR